MTALQGDAAITWTEDGQPYVALLAEPLRDVVAQPRQRVDQFESEDGATIRRIAIGSEYRELDATIRYHGHPDLLEAMLVAGMRGADMLYYESVSDPSAVPFTLMSHGPIAPDSQLWFRRRYEVRVRFRRTDGAGFGRLTDQALFRYSAGGPIRGEDYTRAGAAPYVGVDGVLASVAANVPRTTWVNGVAYNLLERPRTNVQSEDDLSAWTNSGGATVTSGVDDPEGGTGAYRVEDADGVGFDFIASPPLSIGAGSGLTRGFHFTLRRAGSPSDHISLQWRDETAGVSRADLDVTWEDDGTPVVVVSAGVALGFVGLSNGYTEVVGQATGVEGGNTNTLRVLPGSPSAGDTGAVDVFRANAFDAEWPPLSILDASTAKNVETYRLPWDHPPQAMMIYGKILGLGTEDFGSSEGRVIHIGGAGTTPPRFEVLFSGGDFEVFHANGEETVSASVAAGASYLDVIEFVALLHEDGSVDGVVSVNGAAPVELTRSAPAAFRGPWSDWWLYLNQYNAVNGQAGFAEIKADRGVRPLSEALTHMRAL